MLGGRELGIQVLTTTSLTLLAVKVSFRIINWLSFMWNFPRRECRLLKHHLVVLVFKPYTHCSNESVLKKKKTILNVFPAFVSI